MYAGTFQKDTTVVSQTPNFTFACDADKKLTRSSVTACFEHAVTLRVGGLLTFTIWSSMIIGPTKARRVPNITAMTPATINPSATLDLLISMSPD